MLAFAVFVIDLAVTWLLPLVVGVYMCTKFNLQSRRLVDAVDAVDWFGIAAWMGRMAARLVQGRESGGEQESAQPRAGEEERDPTPSLL